MSRPFRFEDGRPQSPFDRPAQNTQSTAPPSFKTNVNRNKTKKWTQAPSYNYDGDEWGGYDPYDEYGSYYNPSQQPALPAQQPQPAGLRERQNSFERGGERRAFSAGVSYPPSGQSSDYQPPQPSYASSSGRTSQEGRSSGEFGVRRDFSQPAHVPQPLQMRMSPSPASAPGNRSPAYLPPRKSSLGQAEAPTNIPEQPEFALPSTVAAGASKPLPFIRPSDIYKRMEEEKERERKSMDSSRPSMDSAQNRPASDARETSQERKSMDSTQRSTSIGRRSSLDPVSETFEQQKTAESSLEPLPERKSEYGFEGFSVPNPILARAIGADVAIPSTEPPATPPKTNLVDRFRDEEATPEKVSPSKNGLPPVNRVASGFGSDFWGSTQLPSELQQYTDIEAPSNLAERSQEPGSSEGQSALQHQPSMGFQSVVHQAFDRQDDNSVPPTPISQFNSQRLDPSDMSRSNTDSTSGISPIMSRVPSAATADSRAGRADSRDTTIHPIAEEVTSPVHTAAVEDPIVGHGSTLGSDMAAPAHSRNVSESQSSSFMPGYRRGMSSPSPSSSPARSPAVESGKRLSEPMQAELENADHTDPSYTAERDQEKRGLGLANIDTSQAGPHTESPDYTTRESDLADNAMNSQEATSPDLTEAAREARTEFLQTHSESPSTSNWAQSAKSLPRATTPITGRESPAPGRVRDLAGRFNEIDDTSRRNSQTSLVSKSSFSSWGRSEEALSLKRTRTAGSPLESPVNEEAGFTNNFSMRPAMNPTSSFRPHLPGEWVSYAQNPESTRGLATEPVVEESNGLQAPTAHAEGRSPTPDTPRAPRTMDAEEIDLTPTTAKRSLRGKSTEPEGTNPVTAVKAAGVALGQALMASVGSQHSSKDFAQPKPPHEEEAIVEESVPRRSVGDVFLRPLQLDRTASSVASSAAPTPPAKDEHQAVQSERSSGYFPQPPVPELESPGSLADGTEEMESDRLRREIERSLTPARQQEDDEEELVRDEDALDAPPNLEQLKEAEQHQSNLHVADHNLENREPSEMQPVGERAPDHLQDTRPGLLDQRFSWEDRKSGLFNAAAGQTDSNANIEKQRSGLHVINTTVSEDTSDEEEQLEHHGLQSRGLTAPLDADHARSPVSPIAPPDARLSSDEHARDSDRLPSPVATSPLSDSFKPLPTSPGEQIVRMPDSTSAEDPSQARIPPFREILAIKSAPDRIGTYNSTRQQFADSDTGLRDWLSGIIAAYPEHAHIVTDAPSKPSNVAMGSMRHRPVGNIMKMAKGLGSSNRTDTPVSPGGDQDPSFVTTRRPSDSYRASPSQQGGGVEKMQTKGKDLLHTAGVLSGKGMVGAKGWLAKGKKKLRESGAGNDKAQSSGSPGPDTPSSLAPPMPTNRSSGSLAASESSPAPSVTQARPRARVASWSSNRLSTTLGRLRATSERSLSRSRPQSLVFADGRRPTPKLQITSDEGPKTTSSDGDLHSNQLGIGAAPMGTASWVSAWEGQDAQDQDPMNEDAVSPRLGILPSPGVDTFTSSIRGASSDGLPAGQVPLDDHVHLSNIHPAKVGFKWEDDDELYTATPIQGRSPEEELRLFQAGICPSGTQHLRDEYNRGEPDGSRPATAIFSAVSKNEASPTGNTSHHHRHKPSAVSDYIPSLHEKSSSVSRSSSVSSLGQRPTIADQGLLTAPAVNEQRLELDDRSHAESQMVQTPTRPPLAGRASLPSQQRVRSVPTSEATTPVRANQSLPQRVWANDSPTLPPPAGRQYRVMNAHDDDLSPPETPLEHTRQINIGYPNLLDPEAPAVEEIQSLAAPIRQVDDGASLRQNTSLEQSQAFDNIQLPDEEIYNHTRGDATREEQSTFDSHPGYATQTSSTTQHRYDAADLEAEYAAPLQASRPPPQYNQETTPTRSPAQRDSPQPAPAPIYDPRQQEAEYVLPGLGPPVEPHRDSGLRATSLFRNGVARSQESPPKATRRPHPYAIADNSQRTFSGDQVPQGTSSSDTQKKRRSGIWNFSRIPSGNELQTSSGGGIRPDTENTHVNAALIAARRARDASMQNNNSLKKVQRSSTTATPPDPDKKKRFSGLGSLFGRSRSSAQEASKRNKLMKPAPKGDARAQAANPGNISAYAAQSQSQQYAPVPPPSSSNYLLQDVIPEAVTPARLSMEARRVARTDSAVPVPNGWSGPVDQPRYSMQRPQSQAPTLPQVTPTRRLHSTRPSASQRFSYMDVPEAFQPTEASFREGYVPPDEPRLSRYYEQTIPPQNVVDERSSMVQDPHSRANSFGQMTAPHTTGPGVPPVRNYSMTSTSGHLSPQVSAESPSYPNRPCHSPISPVDSRLASHGTQRLRDQRMNSLGAVVSQPHRDYGSLQQASSPSFYGQPNSPHASYVSYAAAGSPPPQQHSRQNSGYSGYYIHQPGPPQQESTSNFYGSSPNRSLGREYSSPSSPYMHGQNYRNPQVGMSPPIPPKTPLGYDDRPERIPAAYADPHQEQFYSHGYLPSHPARRQEHYDNRQQYPPQQQRAPTDPRTVPWSNGERNPNGGNERHGSDERVEMRPTAYPGQEWTPRGVEEGRYEWE